jgi:hypothetical protein
VAGKPAPPLMVADLHARPAIPASQPLASRRPISRRDQIRRRREPAPRTHLPCCRQQDACGAGTSNERAGPARVEPIIVSASSQLAPSRSEPARLGARLPPTRQPIRPGDESRWGQPVAAVCERRSADRRRCAPFAWEAGRRRSRGRFVREPAEQRLRRADVF